METIQSSLYAIATGFCLFFALLGRRFFAHLSLSFFIVYLSLESLGFILEWVLLHPASPYKAFWLALLMSLSFLCAPCLWLFALESAKNARPPLREVSILQRGVIALGCLLTLPLVWVAFWVDPSGSPSKTMNFVVHGGMLVCIGVYLLQVPYYLRKCVAILREQTQQSKTLFSNIDDMPLNVLRVLIWVAMGNWCFSLGRTLMVIVTDGPSLLYPLLTFGEVGIMLWAMFEVFKSNVAHTAAQEDAAPPEPKEKVQEKPKYATYALDDDLRERIAQKIQQAMTQDELYKNNTLTLQGLCEHLKENPHYVSQVINQHLETNFYELVNTYRIGAAQQALKADKEATVLSIALAVGYNSKSTFNSAFKRITGMTPSQYR